MKNAALGLRVHSGWTVLVAMCVETGEPVVLLRERVELVKTIQLQIQAAVPHGGKVAFFAGPRVHFQSERRRRANFLSGDARRAGGINKTRVSFGGVWAAARVGQAAT